MTAVYYMLKRNEAYNPQVCVDRAPSKGKISLQNLVNYYTSKGYVVVTGDGELLMSA